MSAGGFDSSKYEADSGLIFRIRVQPETTAATIGGTQNTAPSGSVGAGLPSARARGSKRAIGVTARRVTCSFATPPSGYKAGELISIPILTPELYNSIAFDDAVSYLGATGKVVGKISEGVK